MKDPPYIFACFSKLKDKENRQKHMADPLKCKNVLLNMCQNLLAVLHSNFLCTHIKYEWLSSLYKDKKLTRGPRYYLDILAIDIFGKSVPIRNFKKWY